MSFKSTYLSKVENNQRRNSKLKNKDDFYEYEPIQTTELEKLSKKKIISQSSLKFLNFPLFSYKVWVFTIFLYWPFNLTPKVIWH